MVMLTGSCARQEEIHSIDGVFKSIRPVADNRNPSVYLEVNFRSEGSAAIYLVDSTGSQLKDDSTHNYRIEGRNIVFYLKNNQDGVLYDPPEIQIIDHDTLKANWAGKVILKRRNED